MRALILTGSLVALFVLGREARAEYDHYGIEGGRSSAVSGTGETANTCDETSAARRIGPAPRVQPAPIVQPAPAPLAPQPTPPKLPVEDKINEKKTSEPGAGGPGGDLYDSRCVNCHSDPTKNAPKLEDKTAEEKIAAIKAGRMPKVDSTNPKAGKLTEEEKTALEAHIKTL